MRKKLASRYTVVGMFLLLLCSLGYATGDKTSELRQKLTEIASLRDSLSGKIAQAIEKRDQLKQKMDELQKEIKLEKQHQRIDSYQKALHNSRIDYNLKLIQVLSGYITGLDTKIAYIQNGNKTLDYFSQQVQDDLLMIKTLNNLAVDELMTQINSVLDEYIPETSKPMFEADGILLEDTEKIWNEIIRTN